MKKRQKPITHGGRRSGAGRKPAGRQPYTIRMKPETHEALTLAATAGNATVGEYLDYYFSVALHGKAKRKGRK